MSLFLLVTGVSISFAGSGKVHRTGPDTGLIDFTAKFTYPPTTVDIADFKSAATTASQIICDATDGQMRFGTITLTGGSPVGDELADVLLIPTSGRSFASACYLGPNQPCIGLEQTGASTTLFRNAASIGLVIAHEFGHLALDLGDEYKETHRMGACFGVGRSIDCDKIDSLNTSLMQSGQCMGISDWTELTVPANHDPIRGDGLPPAQCTPGPQMCLPPDDPRPCNENCHFWNPTWCDYKLSVQSFWSHSKFGQVLSDWEHLAITFPFIIPPTNLPDPNPPPICNTAPVFLTNVAPSDQIVLVLDRSFSMNLAPDNGPCPGPDCVDICDNKWDDDFNQLIDDSCVVKNTSMDFLKQAATAFLQLHDGDPNDILQAVSEAGIVSFSCNTTLDEPLQPVTTVNYDNNLLPAIEALQPSGGTSVAGGLYSATGLFPSGQSPNPGRSIFLVTDGVDTCGVHNWQPVADLIEANGIRVFIVPIGAASGAYPPTSGPKIVGGLVDSSDPKEVVSALVQQWANYHNAGQVVPRLPFVVDAAGSPQDTTAPRTPVSWLQKQEIPPDCPSACSNDLVDFYVEEGTERITIHLAGTLDDMNGFGVRGLLYDPAGTQYDSENPGPTPDLEVIRDRFWMMLRVRQPVPGLWRLETTSLSAALGAAPVQAGNVTVIAENPRTRLTAAVDRHRVDDPSIPVELTIRSAYTSDLLGLQPQVKLYRPDGSVLDIVMEDRTLWDAGYTASLSNIPFDGLYEVRVLIEPDSMTSNHPGEANLSGPSNSLPVPQLQRAAVAYFYVTGGSRVCLSGTPGDCDGDGAIGESPDVDTDGDGLPDDYDLDADNDEIPDALEWRDNADTDGDGTPDYLDPDADGDGAGDADDPFMSLGGPLHRLSVGDLRLNDCGGIRRTDVRISSDEPVAALGLGLQWNPNEVTVTGIGIGPDLDASGVAQFSTTIEGVLGPGFARVDILMSAGTELPPGNNLRVLTVDAQGSAAGGSGTAGELCFADGLGPAGDDTTITVVRGAGNALVVPLQSCGVTELFGDAEPPDILCPLRTVIPVDGSCMATWDRLVAAEDNCDPNPLVTTGALLPVTLGPGSYTFDYAAADSSGHQSQCETTVAVEDWSAPQGGIVAPLDGGCFGAAVTVVDDFLDNCDVPLAPAYEPIGGPTYGGHGDHQVTVSVTDTGRNYAEDSVDFTIDLLAPNVAILGTSLALPSAQPFSDLFVASDSDGAAGDVVAERIYFDDCLVYDGASYGDADGTLSDEMMVLDRAVACEAIARCGLAGLNDAVSVRVEADDCAGNSSMAVSVLPVTPVLRLQDCQPRLNLAWAGGNTEVRWIPEFAAQSYDLVRADRDQLTGLAGMVDLGTTTCIGDDLTALMTVDNSDPPPGKVFVYLLRYSHFATLTPYGWSSSGLPRLASAGDCSP